MEEGDKDLQGETVIESDTVDARWRHRVRSYRTAAVTWTAAIEQASFLDPKRFQAVHLWSCIDRAEDPKN